MPAERVGLVPLDCGAAASSADSLLSLFLVSGVLRELKQCEQTKISSVMHFACAAALCLSRAGYMGFSDRGARRDGN